MNSSCDLVWQLVGVEDDDGADEDGDDSTMIMAMMTTRVLT